MSYICDLCPRNCKVDRNKKVGFCGMGDKIKIARYQKHMWEEPCISGSKGSGTVFFSGCGLKCVYCQNYQVSRGMGEEISEERLAEIFLELQDMGCHNISLVTATQFVPNIKTALDMARGKLRLPVVFNCGGYEKAETIAAMEGYADIYLPDIKYKSPDMSSRYSSCADYYDRAVESVGEMLRQAPECVFDGEGILRKGVIIRHLVLPGGYKDSIAVLEGIAKNFGTKGFMLSLMSQYTPMPACAAFPEINRPVTTFEYKKAAARAVELGFEGYFQDKSSVGEKYIPPFGQNVVKLK